MKKYIGLAFVGFSAVFVVMLLLYVFITLMPSLPENPADYDMDFLLPRLGIVLGGFVVCVLSAIKGIRIIARAD